MAIMAKTVQVRVLMGKKIELKKFRQDQIKSLRPKVEARQLDMGNKDASVVEDMDGQALAAPLSSRTTSRGGGCPETCGELRTGKDMIVHGVRTLVGSSAPESVPRSGSTAPGV